MGHQVYFRFYGELNDFLPPDRRQVQFVHTLRESAAVKDAIEALGVPHPEVDLILVDGQSVGFSYGVAGGEAISVYPRFRQLDVTTVSRVRPPWPPPAHFVLDVHLGKLARYLRLLGFDTLYDNRWDDADLAQVASRDRRILLTQDRGLLKRNLVMYGYCVRSSQPEQQMVEIIRQFDLVDAIAPFSRCLRCNGLLEPVTKASIGDRLPPFTYQSCNEFHRCQDCNHLYWKGGHYQRLQTLVERAIAQA